ncbi:hypothetical protein QU38_01895, partial [Staphylococcus aureus]
YKKDHAARVPVAGKDHDIGDGDVVIAAITSCTNTSNPSVLIAAGLVARKAREKGLTRKPWVKTSLAPGSQVVTDYLNKTGLSADLDAIGINLVGYGYENVWELGDVVNFDDPKVGWIASPA